MKEHVKAVRHDTLRAIENAERLVRALGDGEGAGSEKLRKATKRFAKHLKQELAAWDDKYKKARGKDAKARPSKVSALKGNGKTVRPGQGSAVSQDEKRL